MIIQVKEFLEECRFALLEAADALNADVACAGGCLATPAETGMLDVAAESKQYRDLAKKFDGTEFEPSEDDLFSVLDACRVAAFDLAIQSTYNPAVRDEVVENTVRWAKLALQIRTELSQLKKKVAA